MQDVSVGECGACFKRMKQLTDVMVDAGSPAHSGSHPRGEEEAMQFSAFCFLVNITILNNFFIAKKI